MRKGFLIVFLYLMYFIWDQIKVVGVVSGMPLEIGLTGYQR